MTNQRKKYLISIAKQMIERILVGWCREDDALDYLYADGKSFTDEEEKFLIKEIHKEFCVCK